mgnify:CR=1 FL=1
MYQGKTSEERAEIMTAVIQLCMVRASSCLLFFEHVPASPNNYPLCLISLSLSISQPLDLSLLVHWLSTFPPFPTPPLALWLLVASVAPESVAQFLIADVRARGIQPWRYRTTQALVFTPPTARRKGLSALEPSPLPRQQPRAVQAPLGKGACRRQFTLPKQIVVAEQQQQQQQQLKQQQLKQQLKQRQPTARLRW